MAEILAALESKRPTRESVTEITKAFSHAALNHARVYLCYAEADEVLARQVAEAFHGKGTPCWFAARDVTPAMAWPTCLLEAVAACSSLVLILTERANQNGALRADLEEAVSCGRRILVLKAFNGPVNPALDHLLQDAEWVDVTLPLDERALDAAWHRLLEMETRAPGTDDEADGEAARGAAQVAALRDAKSFLVRLEAREGALKGRVSGEMGAGDRLVIGRGPEADVVIRDSRASRRHAGLVVERKPSGVLELRIVDLLSTNGTWVRYPRPGDAPMSRRLDYNSVRLTDGATLRIGSTDIRVRYVPVPTRVTHLR